MKCLKIKIKIYLILNNYLYNNVNKLLMNKKIICKVDFNKIINKFNNNLQILKMKFYKKLIIIIIILHHN